MTTKQLRADLTISTRLRGHELTFRSTWGLFSPKDIDEGTRLLIDHLELKPDATVMDLGCGYGPLGLTAAKLAPGGQVHLVDKDFVAVEYASQNAKLNGIKNAQAYLSNGFDQVPSGTRFDAVISNLPAKISGELLTIFLQDAHEHLSPGGQLYVVTISGLKDYIKRNLTETFGNYTKLKQSRTYTTAMAVKE